VNAAFGRPRHIDLVKFFFDPAAIAGGEF